MKYPIYVWSSDVDEEQKAQILRDQYQGVSFTEEETDALVAVVQLIHRISVERERLGADPKLSPATEYAVSRGWVIETACGYEPTIAGRLVSDELRAQAGFTRDFEPWEQTIQKSIDQPSNMLPDEYVPINYVLRWLQQWENLGCTNQVILHEDYCYPMLALEDRFAQYPAMRFSIEAVATFEKQGLTQMRNGGLYLTAAGGEKLKEFSLYTAEVFC